MYYQVDESVIPFGKKLYQCTVKARKQLDGEEVIKLLMLTTTLLARR